MNAPESTSGSSLAADWLNALRYWLRGRNGLIALIVLAIVIGGALNWSWLVAAGIGPLLLTVLPCAAMCGLGLCMNRMGGRSCATAASDAERVDPPRRAATLRAAAVEPMNEVSAQPDQPQVLKERE